MRFIAIIAAFTFFLTGCTYHRVAHGPYHGSGPEMYQGYYYARIIYIERVPYYIHDDRRARPIPPHLRHHFRYPLSVRTLPPGYGNDRGKRDGYEVSRIIYLGDVPHYVQDDRHARALPPGVREKFRYDSVHGERRQGGVLPERRREDDGRDNGRNGLPAVREENSRYRPHENGGAPVYEQRRDPRRDTQGDVSGRRAPKDDYGQQPREREQQRSESNRQGGKSVPQNQGHGGSEKKPTGKKRGDEEDGKGR